MAEFFYEAAALDGLTNGYSRYSHIWTKHRSNCREPFAGGEIMAEARLRQINIQKGVVKRLTKEKGSYEKEVDIELARYDKLKAMGKDEHDLNKQMEVINESRAMVPETKNRLRAATKVLKDKLDGEADLAETDEYKEAAKYLVEAEKVLA